MQVSEITEMAGARGSPHLYDAHGSQMWPDCICLTCIYAEFG